MEDFELELKTGFLEEAAQLLTDSEQCFLDLEKAADDPKILEQIFRLAHNLKGSAGAVGFAQVAEFTHKFESLILKFKKGELPITSEGVDLLLRCNDHLKAMIDGLRSDFNANFDSVSLIEELLAAIAGKLQSKPEESSSSPPPQSAAEPVSNPPLEKLEAPMPIEASSAEIALPTDLPLANDPRFNEPIAVQDVSFVPPQAEKKQTPKTENSQSGSSPKSGGAAVDESVRVSLAKLDSLINYVGEMAILQAVLNQNRAQLGSGLLHSTVSQLGKISKNIQEISMGLRMVPIKATFQKMQRIVRDTAQKLGKDVELVLVGEETELDKTVLESIGDPLVHLVRNAVDHGLEMPDERVAKNKDAKGYVWLRAFHQGGRLVIEVQDDGKGLDVERLRKKAIEKGVIPANKQLTQKECYELIFAPGFSTKTEVTDVSGRGVGMDVVRTNIRALEGDVEIKTELGLGTTLRLSLPLTLAIIEGMVVRVGQQKYVLPLAHVHESVRPSPEQIHSSVGLGPLFVLRDEAMPIYKLSNLMPTALTGASSKESSAEETAIVFRTTGDPFAVLVDEIIGQQQVVVKRLGPEVPAVRGLSGSAILGDGRAALILDLPDLSKSLSKKGAPSSSLYKNQKGAA